MAAALAPRTAEVADTVDREEVRARWHAEIPHWYSPWAHLAFPSVVGVGLIGGSLCALRDLQVWQLSMVPLVFVLSNAVEWRAHKHILHRRFWPLEELYVRHTPNHHRVFITEDMVIRSAREFRFVLLPFYAIVAILFLVAPIAAALLFAGQRNLAFLFLASCMAYVLSYEWLHLAYHLPPESVIGRLGIVRSLRRHHATHHDPAKMTRWNFNVTIPLWDWIRGSIHRG